MTHTNKHTYTFLDKMQNYSCLVLRCSTTSVVWGMAYHTVGNLDKHQNGSQLAMAEFKFGDLNTQYHRKTRVKFKLASFKFGIKKFAIP